MKNSKNKSHKIICISITLVTLCSSAIAINKCKDKNGGVFYQDTPCDGGVKLDLPRDSQSDQKSKDPLQIKLESLRIERQNLINSNIARGKVAVGMTAEEVRRSWGSPTKINFFNWLIWKA